METAVCPVTIGRGGELARLGEALRRTRGGQACFAILRGEAGIGKTRLATDTARQARELGMAVLWGGCTPAELSLPYLPYVEAIGNHLSADRVAGPGRGLEGAGHELAGLFPDVDGGLAAADPSDTGQSRLRLFEGVLALLRDAAGEQGLLLVIEDLQWADSATVEMLDHQLRRMRSLPVMVLVTCRETELGRRHPQTWLLDRWRRSEMAVGIDLEPLAEEEVGAMVRAIFAVEVVRTDFLGLLHEHSEGNPYAVEEILKSSLDRGEIARGGGEWQHRPTTHFKLPRSLRDTLLQRLERLPPAAVGMLRAASLLRAPFQFETLVAVAGGSPARVQPALRLAVREQLLEEDPRGDGGYRFRHSLTREAVYEDMLIPEREALHRRAAEALAGLPGTLAIDLCHHLLAARRFEAAVPLALQAAADATRAHAYTEAARLYERILPAVPAGLSGTVHCELGTAQLLAGDTARAVDHLESGVAALESAGRLAEAAHHRLTLGRCLWERDRAGEARAAYERTRIDLEPGGPSEDLALAYVRLASLAAFQLDGPTAVALAQRAEDLAAAAGAEAPRIWSYNFHGLGLIQLNRADEGVAQLDRSYREAAARGLNVIAANALYNSIMVLVQLFRPEPALERLDALHRIHAGSMAGLQGLRAEGTVRLWGTGEPGLARAAFEAGLRLARAGEAVRFVAWLETQLAVAMIQLDQLPAAARLLPAGAGSREGQDRIIEPWARVLLELLGGERGQAADRAAATLTGEAWPLRVRLFLGDLAVEAMLAAGRLDAAAGVAARIRASGATVDHPYLGRMEGRLALAGGDPEAASRLLAGAAATWAGAGARHEAAWTRLALARARERAGEPEAAAGLLREVRADARRRGAGLHARLAAEELTRLGQDAVSVDTVREALERLHEAGAPALAGLAGVLGVPAAEMAPALAGAVARVAAGADPRDAEAGRLLGDYYVRRLGSQELVAERLHLSRATFYRRLHRGWELVAADLGQAAR